MNASLKESVQHIKEVTQGLGPHNRVSSRRKDASTARRDWLIMVFIAAVLISLFTAHSVFVYLRVSKQDYRINEEGAIVRRRTGVLDEGSLAQTIVYFEERSRSFERLVTTPLSTLDPSMVKLSTPEIDAVEDVSESVEEKIEE